LRSIAAKATSANAEDRYASAADLNRDIARFLDGEPVTAHHESPAEKLHRFASRNATLLLLLAAYAVVRFFLFFLRRG